MEAQGYDIKDNIVYQDNQGAMKLKNNGKRSSTKNTHHMEIWYFFITNNIRRNKLLVEYCPTGDMLGDYFTKPQQGSRMRRSRVSILNLPNDPSLISQECVGASDNVKMRTSLRKHPTVRNEYDSTHTTERDSHPADSIRSHDVLRHKAGSYLMVAKGLLNKVSQKDHFIQLI